MLTLEELKEMHDKAFTGEVKLRGNEPVMT